VQRRYPYECSTAKYWAYMYDVLTQPGGIVHRDAALPFAYDIWNVGNGALPESEEGEAWFGKAHIRRLADLARRSIDDWYRALAAQQAEPHAGFFAEKFWPDKLPVVMRELYGDVREVFIVRDFRDVVHSTLSFEEQLPWPATMASRELRGEQGLRRAERSEQEPVSDYVRSMILPTALRLRASWHRRRDEATLVRYEDLVAEPEATVSRLFGDLRLDHDPAIVAAAMAGSVDAGAGVKGHRTSPDTAASVGRWKREADAELTALYDEVFGELLEEFGYVDG
jgi:hypothetical protein